MSKMVHFVACTSDVTAEQTAQLFYDTIFKLHGVPEYVVSDRGTQFVNKFMDELLPKIGLEGRRSTSYHPQTDGQTERTNRTLEQYLRHYAAAQQDDWDEFLASAEFAINNAHQESVQNTPFVLNYGRHPRIPLTAPFDCIRRLDEEQGVRLPVDKHTGQFKVPAAQRFLARMQETLKAARDAMHEAQNRQKQYADLRKSERSFAVEDMVMLNAKYINLKKPAEATRKLLPRFIGPFKVIKKVGTPGKEVAYKLELPESMKRVHPVFHVSLLKPFHGDGREQPAPPPIEVEGETLWLFEDILDDRKARYGRKREYLVKWEGFGHELNSWEPESSFEHATAELDAYWRRDAEKQQSKPAAPTPIIVDDEALTTPVQSVRTVEPINPELGPKHAASGPRRRQRNRVRERPPKRHRGSVRNSRK